MIAFVLFALFDCAGANVEILRGPRNAVNTSRPASTFVYFGAPSLTVSGPTAYLSGREACKPKRKLEGVIVISVLHDLECEPGEAYVAISEARALGFITLERWSPPGWWCFQRPFHSDYTVSMPMVSVTSLKRDQDLWVDSSLELSIAPLFDTTVYDTFTSFVWIISMKVFAAGWALLVAVQCFIEIANLYLTEKTQKSWISFMIFSIEAPTMVAVGVMLILGHGGPYTLPFVFHTFFIDLLSGFSVASNLLLALFLQEEEVHLRTGLPRRDLWPKYRQFFILAGALLAFGSAIVTPIGFFVSLSYTKASDIFSRLVLNAILSVIYLIFLVPCQCYISCVFVIHVSTVPKMMCFFLFVVSNCFVQS